MKEICNSDFAPSAIASRLAGILFALFAVPLQAAPATHGILITMDGVRADLLKKYLDASAPTEFPAFKKLISEGSHTFAARCDRSYSETVPNHVTIITGRPVVLDPINGLVDPRQHGFNSNQLGGGTLAQIHTTVDPRVYKPSIFDVVHDRGFSTALYRTKTRLDVINASFDATNGALDLIGPDNGRDKIDVDDSQNSSTTTPRTPAQVAKVVASITAGSLSKFTMIHIAEPDNWGHFVGWDDAGGKFRDSIRDHVDTPLFSLMTALQANPTYANKVAIIVTSDHGGGGGTQSNAASTTGHDLSTSVTNTRIPFFVWGVPGLTAGTDIYQHLSNRFQPDAGVVPAYSELRQPLRNGDAPNLLLAAMGLPTIPNSMLIPELAILRIEKAGSDIVLRWPAVAEQTHFLEYSDTLTGNWQPQPLAMVTETNGIKELTVAATVPSSRFWRLRKL